MDEALGGLDRGGVCYVESYGDTPEEKPPWREKSPTGVNTGGPGKAGRGQEAQKASEGTVTRSCSQGQRGLLDFMRRGHKKT